MRKLFIILFAALFAPAMASAQAPSLGVKAGTNFAKIAGAGGSSDSMTGLNIGAFYAFPAGANLAIQPEALFSQKGFKTKGGGTDVTSTLTYISVPVLAKLSFGTEGGSRPFVFAGPELGMMLSAKASGGGASVNIKDGFKSMDLGGVVGAGIDLGKISLDARYGLGLSSVMDGASAKNRAMTVMLGYTLR